MGNPRVGPLVRAIRPDSVTIWTEWNHSCDVTLNATSSDHLQKPGTFSVCGRTVTVGGRHYALSLLTGLQPATWYTYQVSDSAQESQPCSGNGPLIQCFRTLDLPNAGIALRLAYGSCRRLSAGGPDTLSALGSWLLRFLEERETRWPHILLLIGDQIYADDSVDRGQQAPLPPLHSQTPQRAARSFEEFARFYTEAWTRDEGIRQVLAALPTSMIFDDHEITNGWNSSPTWRAHTLQQEGDQTLVDGLVAYWVYQGWGNIGLQGTDGHDLFAIMQRATQSGVDALNTLRGRVRQAVYEEKMLQWDYTLPTTPPIFVADVRADRPATWENGGSTEAAPRIMSQEQMARLHAWIQKHDASMALLISSVPALLPPLIGLAEYLMGIRPFQHASSGPFRQLGRRLAYIQQWLALRMSFDHWPVFGATWCELIELLARRQRDLVVLSGDVHFSYAMSAHCTLLPSKRRAALYQFVASPFKNTLGGREKSLVRGQAWIKRASYGRLHSHMLPLRLNEGARRIPSSILFRNIIALVTFSPHAQNKERYTIQHIYLGINDTMLEEIASTIVYSD
ncbi:MAG TPA: alkaline phosphatase D family protein [Ktedonobacteraceae bacterium]|nr:alkaline phosphatase D family protein [Ktedonobacteraceae bacterium]